MALNGGTISDAATNAATLTLPTPGTTGSLRFNKAIVIDTTSPSPTASALANANGTITPTTDELKVTFSEPLDVSTICSGWTGAADQSLGGPGVVVT